MQDLADRLPIKRIWRPVKQQAADSFLLLFIAASGVTVIVVRLMLELSGYPQLGDSTFHIAHMLYGGVLLTVALGLLLTLANHWALWAASVIGGVGVGLFIDEVGKFITQSNDYFFPLAFPIIYAFMVVYVWLYLRVRRTRARDTRTLLYHALEDLKQVLDNDLDPFEHKELVDELNQVCAKARDANELALGQALLNFVETHNLQLASSPNLVEREIDQVKLFLARYPPRRIYKTLIIFGFALFGAGALFKVGALLTFLTGGLPALHSAFGNLIIISGKSRYVVDNPLLLLMQTLLVVFTGALAAAAALLVASGRERLGLRFGTLGLAFALTVVNLVTFYFSQLYAVFEVFWQLVLLIGAMVYRWRFLDK